MKVWRLMIHHIPERIQEALRWSREEGVIAIGWGQTGDLRKRSFRNQRELTSLVADGHPWKSRSNHAHGGASLWRMFHEVNPGDLVILSGGRNRVATMRVTGDYHFVDGTQSGRYEHRRSAEPISVDPDRLWLASGRMARGENIRSTFIRCSRDLTVEEINPLIAR